MTFNAEESASFSLPSSVSFWALMWYDRFDIDKVAWFSNGQRKVAHKELEIFSSFQIAVDLKQSMSDPIIKFVS